MSMSLEELIKQQNKLSASNTEKKVTAVNDSAEASKKVITDEYNAQIAEAKQSYDELYDQNSVQKLINERQIAENMANMGLTDSGLNRTQMTANQLSYANTKSDIDIQRQKAVETLARTLAAKVSEVETDRSTKEQSIRTSAYDQDVANATSIYNANTAAAQDAIAKHEDSQKVDYSSLKTVTSDILTEEEWKEKANYIANRTVGVRGNTNNTGSAYIYNGKLYKTYQDYVYERLREHYDVFGTINEGTLNYLMNVVYKLDIK